MFVSVFSEITCLVFLYVTYIDFSFFYFSFLHNVLLINVSYMLPVLFRPNSLISSFEYVNVLFIFFLIYTQCAINKRRVRSVVQLLLSFLAWFQLIF